MSKLIFSDETNPHYNLALEDELLREEEDAVCLYLWQNRPTVVVGHNQNAYAECDLDRLQQLNVALSRRLSGGGAVYHDLGNLNFTFVMPERRIDMARQNRVLLSALSSLGLDCNYTGRNDILCCGKKCSGQAFYTEDGRYYHHGTIMVAVNLEMMEQVLSPSAAKLGGNGVQSVRSRVGNLAEFRGGLTVEETRRALCCAFDAEYGGKTAPTVYCAQNHKPPRLPHYQSVAWNLGVRCCLRRLLELRLPQGMVQVYANCDAEQIREAQVFSDSLQVLDQAFLSRSLIGCPFTAEQVRARLNLALQGAGLRERS